MSPLRKKGVERARLKFKNYFPDPELDMDFTLKKTRISVVNYTYQTHGVQIVLT